MGVKALLSRTYTVLSHVFYFLVRTLGNLHGLNAGYLVDT